jgi:hypothetical protein
MGTIGNTMSMGEIEPSISDGSRGGGGGPGTSMGMGQGMYGGIRTPGRSMSVRSGPPPYMPASEGVISRAAMAGEDRKVCIL